MHLFSSTQQITLLAIQSAWAELNCRCCFNYIFILDLNPWLQWLGQRDLQDETRIDLYDFYRLILEILRYLFCTDLSHWFMYLLVNHVFTMSILTYVLIIGKRACRAYWSMMPLHKKWCGFRTLFLYVYIKTKWKNDIFENAISIVWGIAVSKRTHQI